MKYNLKYTIAALAVILLLFASHVSAAPSGANADEISEETYTNSPDTATVEGGNVTGVNITGNQQTTRWAGFFGNISGGIVLKDSSGDSFYEWTVSDITGSIVYAANESVSSWAGLTHADDDNIYSWLKTAGANDAYNETFNAEDTETFNGGSITANSTTTWNGTGVQGHLRTYSLLAGTTLVWANVANQSYTGFEGTTLDYQILVPANSTNTMTYSFYLEIP